MGLDQEKIKKNFQEVAYIERVVMLLSMTEQKAYNPNDLVTKGYLTEYLDLRFAKQDESVSRMFGLVMRELEANREAISGLQQSVSGFERGLLRHDYEVASLDERVLRLETGK